MVELEKPIIMVTALILTSAILYWLFVKPQQQASKSQQLMIPLETITDKPMGETRQQEHIVTTTETILGHENPLDWFSVNIYNDGPGNLYYSINKRRRNEAPLQQGQSINIPFNVRGSIKKMFLKSDSTATVHLNAIK